MKKLRWMVYNAIVAALYVVLCVVLSPLSYGAVQVRISDALVWCGYVDRRFIPGLCLGGAWANMFSPLGVVDVVVGTMGQAVAFWIASACCAKLSGKYNAAVFWLTVSAIPGVFVGAELSVIYGIPAAGAILSVCAGEALSVAVGFPFMAAVKRIGNKGGD